MKYKIKRNILIFYMFIKIFFFLIFIYLFTYLKGRMTDRVGRMEDRSSTMARADLPHKWQATSTWTMCCCWTRHISMELDENQRSWYSNQNSDWGCQHHRYPFYPLHHTASLDGQSI